jgi:RNA polymerase primary sigma factor
VVGALGDEDIEIVDGATQVKIAPKRIAEEEAGEKKLVVGPDREEEDVDYYSKSNDPVRMYLRKMGSVSLLTREGEVEIAKRIEQGELRSTGHPRLADRRARDHRLGREAQEAQDPRQGPHQGRRDDDQEFDEEEADRRIIRLIEKVKRLDKKKATCSRSARRRRTSAASRSTARSSETNDELVKTLEEMRLNKKTIDKIVQKLKSLILKVEKAEAGATELEKRTASTRTSCAAS